MQVDFLQLFILNQLSLPLVPGPTDPSLGSPALSPHNAEPEPTFLPTEGGEQHCVELHAT